MKTRKKVYESPFLAILRLEQGMVICASNGETENYNPIALWEIGDNE